MDIPDIRDALATLVSTAVTASSKSANVYAYPPESPELPAMMILPAPFEDGSYVNYWGSFGRHLYAVGLRLELRIPGTEVDAARTMDVYLSTVMPAIIEALKANPTLSGACETILLRSGAVPGRFAPSEAETARTWLASSVPIEVHARKEAP